MYRTQKKSFNGIHWIWEGALIWQSRSLCEVSDTNSKRTRQCAIAVFFHNLTSASSKRSRIWVKLTKMRLTWKCFRKIFDCAIVICRLETYQTMTKKRIAKRIQPLGESSDYQNALYFLTVFLCKFDSNKAISIIFCFARLCKKNDRRQVNKHCKNYGHI